MTYLSGQILKGVQIQTVAADRNCGSVIDSRKLRFIPSLQLNYFRHLTFTNHKVVPIRESVYFRLMVPVRPWKWR